MGLDSSCSTSLTAPAGHLLPRHLQQLQAPRTAIHVRAVGTKAATRTAAPSFKWTAKQHGLHHSPPGSSKGRACSIKVMGLFGKSSTKFSFSFSFSQKYQIKNILTFLHFLHHINNFLLLFNQKNLLQNKTFSLFYKTFSNFLSHQSFLTTIQINISIHNHLPNKPDKTPSGGKQKGGNHNRKKTRKKM